MGEIGLARSNLVMTVLVASTLAMFAMVVVFMVAAWWLRRSNDRKAAKWAAVETRWRALLNAISAGTLAEDELHAQVSAGERLVLVDFLYKQVINDTRPEYQQLCRRMAKPYLGEVSARVRTGDVWQRARAVRTLAELAGPEQRGAIKEAMDDSAAHVAQTAARAYARLGMGPVEALLQRLDRYRPWDRRLLRQTIASMGPEGAPTLLRTLQDPTVPTPIRYVCADALATLRHEGVNDAALQVLRTETDLELRAAALRLFHGALTDEQRDAVRTLSRSADPILQGQAFACLARIGDERDLADLQEALDHPSPWVRFNAARGLSLRAAEVPVPAGDGTNGQE